MTPADVQYLVSRAWGRAKIANLNSPTLGDGQSWAENIMVVEEIIEDVLRRSILSPLQSARAQIVRRMAINNSARDVSNTPRAYALPLYISEGLLLNIANSDAKAIPFKRGKKPLIKLSDLHVEHTVPLAQFCSGTRILANPDEVLPLLRRAIISPISYITNTEKKSIKKADVKKSVTPFFPFRRYEFKVYHTVTGEFINPEHFSFRDHIRVMGGFPAYATAVPLFRTGKRDWRTRIATIHAECAHQQET